MTIGWAIVIVGVLYLMTISQGARYVALALAAAGALVFWAAMEGNQTAGNIAAVMFLPFLH